MRIKGFLSGVYVKVKRWLHWPWQPFERLNRGVLNHLRLKANTLSSLSLDPLPAHPWQNHISPLCLFKCTMYLPKRIYNHIGCTHYTFFHWLNCDALNDLWLKANTASAAAIVYPFLAQLWQNHMKANSKYQDLKVTWKLSIYKDQRLTLSACPPELIVHIREKIPQTKSMCAKIWIVKIA